jgi:hypothetical protein
VIHPSIGFSKIFSRISSEEFIKSYVTIIEDVKRQVNELDSGLRIEEINYRLRRHKI